MESFEAHASSVHKLSDEPSPLYATQKTQRPESTGTPPLIQSRLVSMHVFESSFRVLGLQLVKSGLDGFKGSFCLCLVPIIRRAVQVGY